jgi:hypothetical protein
VTFGSFELFLLRERRRFCHSKFRLSKRKCRGLSTAQRDDETVLCFGRDDGLWGLRNDVDSGRNRDSKVVKVQG